jgi:tetratricopeptide (TPR) repeat protein
MQSNRHGGTRIAILALLLLICALVKTAIFLDKNPPSFSKPVSTLPEQDLPPRAHGSVIYLEANHEKYHFRYRGMIVQELFRQAVLIAARDGMGLQTRDASLREWRGKPPQDNTLEMDFPDAQIILREGPDPSHVRWRQDYAATQWTDDLADLVEKTEKMSRDVFPSALHKDGWSGSANAIKSDAPPPPDADTRLMEMEELSQFAVLRETHAAIQSDGESLQRSGALVRAYANLGQLTRYHWSAEFAAYTARSLLYSQRMVINNPDSAFALWHRAYARALAGMQGYALKDLAAAADLKDKNRPDWVTLLEPFCKFQTENLVNLATENQKLSTLGMYLAFLSAEYSGSQGATMNVAAAAFTINPQCLRIVDTMCDHTGPGMLNELVHTGPDVFSKTLGLKLQKMPSLPQSLVDQINHLKQPGGNPDGRGRIKLCRELIAEGAPEKDNVEPSWAALGRLIQETTFAHFQRMDNLVSEQWGVDASEDVKAAEPFVMDHPFKFVIETYGFRHSADMATLKRTLNEPEAVAGEMTLRQIPIYWLERQIETTGPDSDQNLWQWMLANSDYNSFDIEAILLYNEGRENDPWVIDQLNHLRRVCPDSPALIAADIRGHWDPEKAATWEAEHGDYPTVAMALGKKYTELHRWADAARCLRKYIAVSPDRYGYEALANVYKTQKNDDLWMATLNEFIAHGQAYGLEDANVQVEIAHYYMNKRDFKSAIPYADAASGTASAWGLTCAAEAHSGIGDWTTAEQLIMDEKEHYSESPFTWYAWCSRTGHGDFAAAQQAWLSYFSQKGDTLDSEDSIRYGCLQMSRQKNAEALTIFKRRMKLWPGPNSALHIAILDDELHDLAGRDAMLNRIQTLPERNTPSGRFGEILRDAIKSNSTVALNAAALDPILNSATEDDRICICALTGRFLQDRGHTAQAVEYFKRCVDGKEYSADRPWVDYELRQNGQDPWALEQAAIGPDSWQ